MKRRYHTYVQSELWKRMKNERYSYGLWRTKSEREEGEGEGEEEGEEAESVFRCSFFLRWRHLFIILVSFVSKVKMTTTTTVNIIRARLGLNVLQTPLRQSPARSLLETLIFLLILLFNPYASHTFTSWCIFILVYFEKNYEKKK